ncbi:MAG: hypothetical protein K2Z81_10005, partial [Cyanobacteria bacterium]|nr:hypothetical protein [Cyanobacteriota bacterium]
AQSLRMDRNDLQNNGQGSSDTALGDSRWHERDRTLDSGHQTSAAGQANFNSSNRHPSGAARSDNLAPAGAEVSRAQAVGSGSLSSGNLRDKVSYHEYDQAGKLYKLLIGLIAVLVIVVMVAGYFIYEKFSHSGAVAPPAVTTESKDSEGVVKDSSSSASQSSDAPASSQSSETATPAAHSPGGSTSSQQTVEAQQPQVKKPTHRRPEPPAKPKSRPVKQAAIKAKPAVVKHVPAAKIQPAKKKSGADPWKDLMDEGQQ